MASCCEICGQKARLSKEHVFPTWLRAPLGQDATDIVFARPGGEKRWTSQHDLGVTVGGICTGCNNGWMERLETDVRALITPFIQGAWPTLRDSQRATLACWSLKMAMVVDLMSKERFFLPADRRALSRQEPIALNVTVWQGRLLASFMASSVDYRVWWTDQDRREVSGFVSTITVGHALLQTVLMRADDPRGLPFRPEDWNDELARVWPTLGTPFPPMPRCVVTQERLGAIIDRCRSGVPRRSPAI